MAVGMATDGVFCRGAAAVSMSTDGVICATAVIAGAWQEIKRFTVSVHRMLSFQLEV